MAKFCITYSIATSASVWHGEYAYTGFMTRNETCPRRKFNPKAKPHEFSFREVIRILREHDSGREGVGASDSPWCPGNPPRWLSVSDTPGYMPSKGVTELNLHLDKAVKGATACRIARLLGAAGERKPKPQA